MKILPISTCISVKVLIDSADTNLPIFTDIIRNSIRNDISPFVILLEMTYLQNKFS